MSEGRLGQQPLAASASSAQTDHFGGSPRLVDEHQSVGVEVRLVRLPGFTRLSDVGPVLLGGVQSFF